MAPELFYAEETEELCSLAQRIREYQEAQRLSDNELIRRIPALGSTKTYKRVLARDLDELSLDTQLANYRSAWAFIEAVGTDSRTEEVILDDLFPVIELRRAFLRIATTNTSGRVIVMDGPTGAGKTCARRHLLGKYGARLLMVEASVAWNDSPFAMIGVILAALGQKEIPPRQVDAFNRLCELLRQTRRGLIIEEAHHCGPRCLNLIKSLVNLTPGEFILLAIDSLWRKLESVAYEEARQLTGNRMGERIKLGFDLRETDIKKMLVKGLTWAAAEDIPMAVKLLASKASNYGRLAFVRDVIKRACAIADGSAVSIELFTSAFTQEVASR